MRRLHHISVLNRCSVLADEQVNEIVKALQKQVTNHFSPLWGIGANLNFVPRDDTDSWRNKWNLLVLDTSDEANALGYHDFTPEGNPVGKAFVKTDQMGGYLPSVTMSHELLEMLGDPDINLCAEDRDGTLYAYENCDAVEADELGYDIDGVTVSDFVTPEWFAGSLRDVGGIKFDFKGHVTQPFELAKGGYISVRRPNEGWDQIFAQDVDPLARPRVGSRRERRSLPTSQLVRSED